MTTDEQGAFYSGMPEGSNTLECPANNGSFGSAVAHRSHDRILFTRDFHLCKGFDPASPANNESVTSRPILQWNPYPDAVRYVATVLSPTAQVVYTRGAQGQPLTETSVQVDVALAPGGYQWRVSAFNAAGQMIGCSYGPWGFTVRSQP